ncbi:LysR family transcriptional regulator [Rhodococcus sp. SC4]|uniref:LysR family transcriptional regulator n=1 Tax=Rhodococcus koreensis TaxID=99653 RepID=UPI00076A0031|nr:LysR family transcriptional regulator [Rhodococcus koreensis]KXF52744.1 LysR family transcriptional regulator [Rhodococcus sp. SC4]QSE86209.1 LysR family transcriptional regulator [Rhodococcus koreensis]
MFSADDLKLFLEVARRGRLTEAAKHLQINHTTVSRHITRLERAVENRLFDRTSEGWTLTDAGAQLLVHAEMVEAAVLAAQEDCLSRGPSLTGHVRIIAPDGFGAYLLLPGLGDIQRQHPGLIVEVVTANRHASLTPREFDLAITIERPQARAVTVQRLANYSLGFYASHDYLASHPPVETLEDLYNHVLIWYVDTALDFSTFNLLYELLPNAQAQIQTNNIAGFIQSAEADLGIALLPSFIADGNPRLQRLTKITAKIERSYWISVPRDLVRLARVRVMSEHIEKLVANASGLHLAR